MSNLWCLHPASGFTFPVCESKKQSNVGADDACGHRDTEFAIEVLILKLSNPISNRVNISNAITIRVLERTGEQEELGPDDACGHRC